MPEKDAVAESIKIVNEADSRGITLRLLGGIAFRLRNPSSLQENLKRHYVDIDLVGLRKQKKEIQQLFTDLGYSPRTRFNLMNGQYRLIFNDIGNQRRVDIFLNSFEMSHKLDFSERLGVDKVTLPLADLLLTKLQVYEITEREYKDVVSLLKDHEIGSTDANDTINEDHVAKLCSQDWGLWRTVQLNLERIERSLSTYSLSPQESESIKVKMERLRKRIESEPKSLGWKMRARVGDRVKWYEIPEADVEIVDSRPLADRLTDKTDTEQ